ncbi:hypothetical protein Tco_1050133 [Tanacetum coccineum]
MSSFEQRSCFSCGNPLDDLPCRYCTCERCGYYNRGVPCLGCNSETENSFTYEPTPYSYNDSPNLINPPPQPQTYSCELCGNDHHYGSDCLPRFPLVYEPEPCYNQNYSDNFYPQNSQSYPQQYLCCENCGGPHETFQCQPMNQNYYEPNPCYNSNSSGFDQFQPPQYSVVHQPPQETSTEMLQARENLMEAIQAFLKKYDQIPPKEKSMALLLAEERFLKIKQAAAKVSSQYWKPPIFYNDDDEESYIPLRDIISELPLSVAITPDLPITDSLIIEDEHLNNIPETESDEENESSVKDLNLTSSESEDLSDNKSECDVLVCDDSFPNFMTFSNPLFDSNDDFTSSKDESFSEEDVPKENFKIYSNPLFEFDEEIISSKIDPLYNETDSIPQGNDNDHFNAESDLIESLLNRDTSMVSSPKIDSLLEEFSGELAHIDSIPLGIDEADFDPEDDIRLVEKLLYDNSSPRAPEELNSEISDAIIESFSPSPIPVEDSDSLIEDIDIFLALDD